MEQKKTKNTFTIVVGVLLVASLVANALLLWQNLRLNTEYTKLSFWPIKESYIYTGGDGVVCDVVTNYHSEEDFFYCHVMVNGREVEPYLSAYTHSFVQAEGNLCIRIELQVREGETQQALQQALLQYPGSIQITFQTLDDKNYGYSPNLNEIYNRKPDFA